MCRPYLRPASAANLRIDSAWRAKRMCWVRFCSQVRWRLDRDGDRGTPAMRRVRSASITPNRSANPGLLSAPARVEAFAITCTRTPLEPFAVFCRAWQAGGVALAAQRGFAASEGADRVGAPAVDGARVTFVDGAGHRIESGVQCDAVGSALVRWSSGCRFGPMPGTALRRAVEHGCEVEKRRHEVDVPPGKGFGIVDARTPRWAG